MRLTGNNRLLAACAFSVLALPSISGAGCHSRAAPRGAAETGGAQIVRIEVGQDGFRLSIANRSSGRRAEADSGWPAGSTWCSGVDPRGRRSVSSWTGQTLAINLGRETVGGAGQAARRSYRWCRPPTSGRATISPMAGG